MTSSLLKLSRVSLGSVPAGSLSVLSQTWSEAQKSSQKQRGFSSSPNRSSESSPGEGLQEFLSRRQSDSILMDSQYQQQMVLRDFLGAILQSHRWVTIRSSSAHCRSTHSSLLLPAFQGEHTELRVISGTVRERVRLSSQAGCR